MRFPSTRANVRRARRRRQLITAAHTNCQIARRDRSASPAQSPLNTETGARWFSSTNSMPSFAFDQPARHQLHQHRRHAMVYDTNGFEAGAGWRWRDQPAKSCSSTSSKPILPHFAVDDRWQRPAQSGHGAGRSVTASAVPATTPRSAARCPARQSRRSAALRDRHFDDAGRMGGQKRAQRFRQNSVNALVFDQLPGRRQAFSMAPRSRVALGLRRMVRACCSRYGGLGRGYAPGGRWRSERNAKRVFHVANAGRGGGKRQIRPLGAMRNRCQLRQH